MLDNLLQNKAHIKFVARFLLALVSLRQNGVGTGFVMADAILPRGHEELQREEPPEKVRAWMQSVPDWIETREADISQFIPENDIHEGEREAIALALELRADVLLCDDRDAGCRSQVPGHSDR